MKATQERSILEAVCKRWISPLEALQEFGCLRLAARIADLKAAGWPISDRWRLLPQGKRVKEYRLEPGWLQRKYEAGNPAPRPVVDQIFP